MVGVAKKDGTSVQIAVEDAGQQKGYIDDIKRLPELRPYTIRAIRPHGDKLNRSLAWGARAEMGGVDVCRGLWNSDFFDECDAFTADDTHDYDDQIDAVSGAYQVLATPRIIRGIRKAY
jgi:predicted phage terminase large subunit-like protein